MKWFLIFMLGLVIRFLLDKSFHIDYVGVYFFLGAITIMLADAFDKK